MEVSNISEKEVINVKGIPSSVNDQKKGGIQFIVYDADTKKPVKANIYVGDKTYNTDDGGKLYLELEIKDEFSIQKYVVKADGYKDETGHVIVERSEKYVQEVPLKKATSTEPKQILPKYQHSFSILVINKLTGKPYQGALVNIIESSPSGKGFKWTKITDSSGRAFFRINNDMSSGILQVFAKNYKPEDLESWHENKHFNFTDTKVFIKDSEVLQLTKTSTEETVSERGPETIEYKPLRSEESNDFLTRIGKTEEELEKPKEKKEVQAQRRASLLFQLLDTLLSDRKITEEEYNQIKQEVDAIAYSELDLARLFPKKIKVVIRTYKTKESNLDMDELFEHERKNTPSGYSYYIYNVIRLNSLIETKLKAFVPFPDFYYKSGCYIFGPYYDSDYGIPSVDIIIRTLKDYMIPKPFQPWFMWIAETVIPDVRKQRKEAVGKIYYYKET